MVNKFGECHVFDITEIPGKVEIICSACASVMCDALSWATMNPDRMSPREVSSDFIVVLGCQVTDLAVLSDFAMARRALDLGKEVYIGGCLGQRLDIPLPEGVKRIDVFRGNDSAADINKARGLVRWAKPFWVPDDEWITAGSSSGRLFRDDHFIQIGAGCERSCKYCTIRHTRGTAFEIAPDAQEAEFRNAISDGKHVVLISDNPTAEQIVAWCEAACCTGGSISSRNVEPDTAVACADELLNLAKIGLLDTFHCPVQSTESATIVAMGRNAEATRRFIEAVAPELQFYCKTATNIILDYQDFPNPDYSKLACFDVINWNPYWDGVWDETVARERFGRYLKGCQLDILRVD